MNVLVYADIDIRFTTIINFYYFRQIQSGFEIVHTRFTPETKDGVMPENGCDKLSCEDRDLIECGARIPIKRLIHVTHLEAAMSISDIECNDSKYVFKSSAKRGKSSGTHVTYSPTCNEGVYRRVSEDECVFCNTNNCQCSFSWWGIDVKEWYEGDGKEFGELVRRLEWNKIYVADFLHNPPESRYGTQGFSIEFPTLIEQYKESRTDSDAQICFRMGGTLRYFLEITYVIIVCMGQELINLQCINSQTDSFEHNGLLNEFGDVEDLSKTPNFRITYLIKGIYPGAIKCDWENLAFAFYFPNSGELKCKQSVITICAVPHYIPTCLKKDSQHPCPDYFKNNCKFCPECKKLNCHKHSSLECIIL